ncbi:MAG: FAD-binding oxidoreductase [Sandaracinaceae bacterium]|nr:FAD-binding oxidoreductase [Sandaracinaceae bacterium]
MTPSDRNRGSTFRRGEPGYEAARRATCWNQRLADRFPDVIVQANDEAEVVTAMQRAAREGLKVGVRSGGHSWAGNHVRDGGMLLDVSRLRDVQVDTRNLRATAGPGCAGHELAETLRPHGLFFPAGHCKGVCIGGYLLQGGFGWHGRKLGLACMSVLGIDYVDAAGQRHHASPTENEDMYWAARGAGPGFFGVVTRFHVRVYERPRFMGMAMATYPLRDLERVFRWAHALGPSVPDSIELMLLLSRSTPGVRGPGITVLAPVFEDSFGAATRAASFMKQKPHGARLSMPLLPMPLDWMYRAVMHHYPAEHRYAVDNMWTHAPIDALLPGLERIGQTLPPAPSHMLWMNWSPPRDRPPMAFSLEDDTYIAFYGVWKDAQHDAQVAPWAGERMREMAHLATGIQLADENLAQRPARFVADANLAKLDAVRALRDAPGRFHPWMGRP